MIKLVLAMLMIPLLSGASKFASVTIGEVKDSVVTSREVMLNLYIESALFNGSEPPPFKQEAYKKKVNGVLLEWAVFLEAVSFNTEQIKAAELSKAVKKVVGKWRGNPKWQALEATAEEIAAVVERKLRAKQFIKFKANSSLVPVTREEALDYYNANKNKFGKLKFDGLEANIKAFLRKQQLDLRLKSWFEVLQSKYQVRNLLI